ncbi:MAG TPA: DUF1698 domain-containing protein [Azospirillum sp.]
MDLRPFNPSQEQIERARDLACRSLLCYQPFEFSDDLVVGMGHQMMTKGRGMVHTGHIPDAYKDQPGVKGVLVDPEKVDQFRADNLLLDDLYQRMVNFIESKLGAFSQYDFAEVGCCSGYFPIQMAMRGARSVTGYDRIDYSPTFKLLNEIVGTDVQFFNKAYRNGTIEGAEPVDVVMSVAVILHISDILQHLAFLGSIAKKAMFVWTNTMAGDNEDEENLLIRYNQPNRYYKDDKFPYGFDCVFISPALLRLSLTEMGFTEIHEFTDRPEAMDKTLFRQHRGYLAIRP